MLVHEGKVKISGADRDRDNPKKDLAKQAWVKACIQPMQRMGEKRFVACNPIIYDISRCVAYYCCCLPNEQQNINLIIIIRPPAAGEREEGRMYLI